MNICNKNGLTTLNCYDSWQEALVYEFYEQYYISKDNIIYEIVEKKNIDESDIFIAHFNSDDIIDFELQYYNGGCGFSEALDIAMNNLEKDIDK